MKNAAVIELLNKIMEMELAGVVRYTHYSLMVYGFGRIPIVSWLRGEALTSLQHAQTAGELVTHLGSHPSLAIGPLLETHKHQIADILRESGRWSPRRSITWEKLTRCCANLVRSAPSRCLSRPQGRPVPSRAKSWRARRAWDLVPRATRRRAAKRTRSPSRAESQCRPDDHLSLSVQ
jgi:bacterioferritin (cytochrome b1)